MNAISVNKLTRLENIRLESHLINQHLKFRLQKSVPICMDVLIIFEKINADIKDANCMLERKKFHVYKLNKNLSKVVKFKA